MGPVRPRKRVSGEKEITLNKKLIKKREKE
jgi:hypothetical protein